MKTSQFHRVMTLATLVALLAPDVGPLSAPAFAQFGGFAQAQPGIGAPSPGAVDGMPASPGGATGGIGSPSLGNPVPSLPPGLQAPQRSGVNARPPLPQSAVGTPAANCANYLPSAQPQQPELSAQASPSGQPGQAAPSEPTAPRPRVRPSQPGLDLVAAREVRGTQAGIEVGRPRALAPEFEASRRVPELEPLSTIEAAFETLPPGLGTLPAPLRQYGYSGFASSVSTFAPVDDIPVGPDYVLGPGDDLSINVWGPLDSTIVRTVDRNGRVVLPKVGDLRVWGLTFSQADRLIREQLARYFRGFQTSVTMGRLRTIRINVVGEVCQPGVYTLSSLSTLTNALFSAGGPTKLGSLRNIRLLRNHHTVGTLDLYDFLQRGDRARDFRLESEDTIFVPTIGDVAAVAGEVKRPAIYEIRGEVRVSHLFDMAGGLTPRSYLKRVQIVRSQPSAERVTLDVDLSQYYLKGDEASNPSVNAGDLVLIHRSDSRIYNTVKVDGAVKYPGAYELKPMMRIGQLLPPDKLLPEAYTDRVEVARRREDLSIEVVPINLRKAWAGDRDQDILLKPLDEVAVRTELKAARTVTLTGQVVRPGTYTIEDGERLSAVLERAGGFTDKAFLKGAVFTRSELRKTELEQVESFVRLQEQRVLASASVTIVGEDKEEFQARQQGLQARRELLKALAQRVTLGRMVVRLDTPEKLRGTKEDIVLVDGDSLDVAEPPASVLVIGAVRNSASVLYKDGANAEYYINRVGGFSKQADKKEVHIAKADGSALAGFTNIRAVEPGDTIVVPPKEEEKIRTLPTIRDVVQIMGGTLLSVAALAVLF